MVTTEFAIIPRLWPDSTIVCLGSGPSLTQSDVDYCRGRARIIAIKDAVRLAPDADVLYACGLDVSNWWPHHGPALQDFAGLRYTLDRNASQWAQVLELTGETGIETKPTGLRSGHNSGAQAINLAVHLGAAKIVLLGYDCQQSAHGPKYFYGVRTVGHQVLSPYGRFLEAFAAMVAPLRALGVTVINATRITALTCFPQRSIVEALA